MEEEIEEKDMTPILIKDLGMEYPTENSKRKYHFGIFKCQYCGKEFRATLGHVKHGNTKSCGCFHGNTGKNKTHGLSGHRFYNTWANMMNRCYNKKNKDYPNYGARGITVCKEWYDTKTFIEWAEETHVEGTTLDRINTYGNYEKGNVRWASSTIQRTNQRINNKNTSGFVGVSWVNARSKWKANIISNYISIHLGYYDNIEDAVKARDNYIKENDLSHKLSTEY